MKTKLALLVALLSILAAAPASAHFFLGNDSVDGREIRWEDYTRYDDSRGFAINQWNALGKVNIAPDAWNTIADLEWSDYSNCYTTTAAYWQPRTGADLINHNTCIMGPMSAFDKRSVSVHEQGHSLGLGHNTAASGNTQIMYYCPSCTAYNAPQAHDRADYFALWP